MRKNEKSISKSDIEEDVKRWFEFFGSTKNLLHKFHKQILKTIYIDSVNDVPITVNELLQVNDLSNDTISFGIMLLNSRHRECLSEVQLNFMKNRIKRFHHIQIWEGNGWVEKQTRGLCQHGGQHKTSTSGWW